MEREGTRDEERLEVQIRGAARMHGHLLFDASKCVRMTSSSIFLIVAIIVNHAFIKDLDFICIPLKIQERKCIIVKGHSS